MEGGYEEFPYSRLYENKRVRIVRVEVGKTVLKVFKRAFQTILNRLTEEPNLLKFQGVVQVINSGKGFISPSVGV